MQIGAQVRGKCGREEQLITLNNNWVDAASWGDESFDTQAVKTNS